MPNRVHLEEDTGALASLLSRLDERTEHMAEDVAQLKHVIIDGNGSPSMVVAVATLTEKVSALESNSAKSKLSAGEKIAAVLTSAGVFVTLLEMIVRHLSK